MNRQVRNSRWVAWALLLAPAALVSACGGDDDNGGGPGIDGGLLDGGMDAGMADGSVSDAQVGDDGGGPRAVTGDLWAYTSNNKLLKFEGTTGVVARSVDATPPAGEVVLGIDVRAANGKIYALTSAGSVYTVDSTTGAFADKQALAQDVADSTDPFVMLDGTSFALDFNPVADRLRVVSNTGQNLRVDVATGKVTTDTPAPETPGLSAGAYTNNWPQADRPCGTTLYVIDAANRKLLLQSPPNGGVLTEVGSLTGLAEGAQVHAFDIVTGASGENVGLLAATGTAGETVYRLDLTSAKATLLSTLTGQGTVVGLVGSVRAARPADKIGELVATTAKGKVVTFERGSPATFCTEATIQELEAGEEVVGGDVRPADKNLWVVTRLPTHEAKLRRLSIDNGTLTAELPLTALENDDNPYVTLDGNNFGVGFDPVSGSLRVISDTGVNLRVDPATGKVTTDASIKTPDYAITELAYTNPTGAVPATTTTLYAIDNNGDRVLRIGDDPAGASGTASPNSGTVTELAPLGFGDQMGALPISGAAIEPVSGIALAALSVGTDDNADPKPATAASLNAQLWLINPAAAGSGGSVATSLGKIGTGDDGVTSLSFTPKP